MFEYCTVSYSWKGQGWTQEISLISINGREMYQWEGKLWNEFLNHMGQKGWELVAATSLGNGGKINGAIGYFKRSI